MIPALKHVQGVRRREVRQEKTSTQFKQMQCGTPELHNQATCSLSLNLLICKTETDIPTSQVVERINCDKICNVVFCHWTRKIKMKLSENKMRCCEW